MLQTSYITRTSHAQARFEASLEADVLRDCVRTKIEESAATAEEFWTNMSAGTAQSSNRDEALLAPGGSMVDAIGMQDVEITDVVSGSAP